MEYRHPYTPYSEIGAEYRQHNKRSGKLENKGSLKNKGGKLNYSPYLRGGYCLLHCTALGEGNIPARKKGEGSGNGNYSETAYLYKDKNNRLSEARPVGSGILYHKSRYTNRRGSGKGRLVKGGYYPRICRYRKHQKKRSQKDYPEKAENNYLKGIEMPAFF